jgi:hypothetical protein
MEEWWSGGVLEWWSGGVVEGVRRVAVWGEDEGYWGWLVAPEAEGYV